MDEKLLDAEEGVIITIDDEDTGPDAEEAEKKIFEKISARESNYEEYTPPKMGFFKTLSNFWYRNKTLVIIAAIGIFAVAYLVVNSIPEKNDFTSTVYVSFSDYATSITYEIEDEIEEYCLDWDGSGEVSAFVNDYNICDEGGMSSAAEYDIVRQHISGEPKNMLWVVEKDLFDMMLEACGEDYFESFEGAPLWIEIKHIDLVNECIEIGECPRIGFCLVRLSDEMSENEELKTSYERAKLVLANMKAAHPEMFEPTE